MKNALMAAAIALSTIAGAASAPQVASAQVVSIGPGGVGIYAYGGRRYCWYDSAWRGPGWYWCGYGARRGYGWGGGYGWNNWRHSGHYYGGGGHYGGSGYGGGHYGGGHYGGGHYGGGHYGGGHYGGHHH